MGHTPTLTHSVCVVSLCCLFACLSLGQSRLEKRRQLPVLFHRGEAVKEPYWHRPHTVHPPLLGPSRFLLVNPGPSWFPMGPPGSSWLLLVNPGFSWLISVSPGFTWFLLVSPGSSWLILVSPGFSWFFLVNPGSSWFLLVSPKLILVSRGSFWFLQHDQDGSPQCWKLLPKGV